MKVPSPQAERAKLKIQRTDHPPVKRNGCCSSTNAELGNVFVVGSVGRVVGGLRHVPHRPLRQ